MEASESESSIPLRFSPLEDGSEGFFCFGDVRQIRNPRKRKKKKEKRFRGIWFSVIRLAPFFSFGNKRRVWFAGERDSLPALQSWFTRASQQLLRQTRFMIETETCVPLKVVASACF